jgi:hypothetical protein
MPRKPSEHSQVTQRMFAAGARQGLQRTLAALAELDRRYETAIGELDDSGAPQSVRERMSHVIKERHRLEREPHARRLEELHRNAIASEVFGPPPQHPRDTSHDAGTKRPGGTYPDP